MVWESLQLSCSWCFIRSETISQGCIDSNKKGPCGPWNDLWMKRWWINRGWYIWHHGRWGPWIPVVSGKVLRWNSLCWALCCPSSVKPPLWKRAEQRANAARGQDAVGWLKEAWEKNSTAFGSPLHGPNLTAAGKTDSTFSYHTMSTQQMLGSELNFCLFSWRT